MAKFLKHAERVERTFYELVFSRRDDPGSGYSFPCSKGGGLLRDQISDVGMDNYRKCRDGIHPVLPGVIRERVERYTEPAVIKCDCCGARVELYCSWASDCPRCGTEYNGGGQRLAPRSQWGEETGESVFDMEQGLDDVDETLGRSFDY